MRELHRSDYFILTVDDERRLVRRTRTARAFASFEEAEIAYEGVIHAILTIDRASHVLLVDVRLAPARNDPAFEQFVGKFSARLFGGFHRAATVCKTQAGRLQIQRLLKDSYGVHAFVDEPAALAYLAIDER